MEESEPERRKGKTIMSNYGLKTYTPEQAKEQWRESMRVELASSLYQNDFFLLANYRRLFLRLRYFITYIRLFFNEMTSWVVLPPKTL